MGVAQHSETGEALVVYSTPNTATVGSGCGRCRCFRKALRRRMACTAVCVDRPQLDPQS